MRGTNYFVSRISKISADWRGGEFVKAKTLLLFVSCACASALPSFGQGICDTSTKLVCEFPVSAVTLSKNTFGSGAKPAALAAAVPINAAIAAQLTQLPLPSATVGVVSIRRKNGEPPAPWPNLGPILTDRPDTVGKGNVFGGVSYQHFNFNALDGFNLNSLPVAFVYGSYLNPTAKTGFQMNYGSMTNTVRFELDQYVAIATVGVSGSTDVSVIVPVNSVNLKVTSSNFTAYTYDYTSGHYQTHIPPTGGVTSSGTATGIGDVTVIVKQMLLGQEHNRPAVALGTTFRFPSGNSLNYLGSGALGGSLFALAEYRAKIAPHIKIGYEWNDTTNVLDLAHGASARLPGGLQYDIGTDYRVQKRLTLAADFLGSQFVNTPSFTQSTQPFNPVPLPVDNVPATYNLVTTPNDTYTTVNFAGGVKCSPVASFLLYGNSLFQLNNVGLRSDVVPLVGIAYNFARHAE
jgi:hypothetical protein